MDRSFLVSCLERSRLPECIGSTQFQKYLSVGHGVGIGHQQQRPVREWRRDSIRGSPPRQQKFRFVRRHSDIAATAVPCTMIVALLTVLRLPARTVGRHPLCRQIPLPDRQQSGQPEHGAAADQLPRNLLSRFRQHGRFTITLLTSALG